MKKNTALWAVTVMAFLIFVPWLGDAYFYSKGEPREAIVAMSMLKSGNWVLPENFGVDIPYKPPLLAWLIAVFSLLLNHGEVSEFTARLPSALAAVALIVATWRLVRVRYGERMAWTTAVVLATSFEFFRAAVACRVDMVLTACMVGGMYAIYGLRKGKWWRAPLAVLLLSGAVLTKGPIGALLPCLVMGVYMLADRKPFWRTLGVLTAICIASFLIPAVWYYAAYQQGGETFLNLAWEENIGRLTGTMSYESHLNPWYYNVITIISGMLPWTVPVLIGLCYKRIWHNITWRGVRALRGLDLFALTAALVVFVFYCIPASKRSVYLLPCYPFLAYGVAALFMRLHATRLMRGYTVAVSVIALVAPIVLIVIQQGVLRKVHAAPLYPWLWVVIVIAALTGLYELISRRMRGSHLWSALLVTYMVMVAYNATYMPAFVNVRSDVEAARTVTALTGEDPVYTVVPGHDGMLRFYSIDFYCNDRLIYAPDTASVPAGAWYLYPVPKTETPPAGAIHLTDRSSDTRTPAYLVKR